MKGSWVKLWTQHTLIDSTLLGESPSYALREPWIDRDAGGDIDYDPGGPGAKRELWTTFKNLTDP